MSITTSRTDGQSDSALALHRQLNIPVSQTNLASLESPAAPRPLNKEHAAFLVGHPLVACHWASRIIRELSVCFATVRGFRVGGGTLIEEKVLRCIGDAADIVKHLFIDAICEGMTNECRKFHEYEDWTANTSNQYDTNNQMIATPSDSPDANEKITFGHSHESTDAVKLAYRFLKTVLVSVHRISVGSVSARLSPPTEMNSFTNSELKLGHIFFPVDNIQLQSNVVTKLPLSNNYEPPTACTEIGSEITEIVVKSVSNSILGLLDGIEWLATRSGNNESAAEIDDNLTVWEKTNLEELTLTVHKKFAGDAVQILSRNFDDADKSKSSFTVPKKTKSADASKLKLQDLRCLIVLSNLAYFQVVLLKKIAIILETKFGIEDELKAQKYLTESASYLHRMLFDNYVRRKGSPIVGFIRAGVLFSGLDWNELKKPTEIRPYCYEILIHLVMVHAEVLETSQSLIQPIMAKLLQHLGLELLNAFRSVDKFSGMGAVQAKMETEFVQQTLSGYIRGGPNERIFELVHAAIEQGTWQAENDANVEHPKSADDATMAQDLLARARTATRMQFRCFLCE
ncbi:hypothetical protein HDU82_004316 [Entophlyctis luteolus]|nr:hypothetical protein HDU82_004316 [Entophlyctis luteolus]